MMVFLIMMVAIAVLLILLNYLMIQTKYIVVKHLIAKTCKACFTANWQFFTGSNSGAILNTLTREVHLVGESFSGFSILLSNIIRLIFYAAIPFYISWKTTLIASGLCLFFVTPLFCLGHLNYKLGKRCTSTANKFTEIIQESFLAAKVILGYGNPFRTVRECVRIFDEHRKAVVKSQTFVFATSKVFEPCGWIAILIAIYVSLKYFSVELAEVATIIYAMVKVIPLVKEIVSQKNSLHGFIPSYEQINDTLNAAMHHVQKSGNIIFKRLDKDIVLKNLSFSYPDREPVLKGINIVIRKGRMVALVGKSGAGKSTLVDLLMGFYQPTNGVTLVDDIPLSQYEVYSFRQCIGYVPQNIVLFNTSIKNNLMWSCDTVTQKDIVAACKIANAHDFIMQLPEGYDTVVGDRGVRLSNGQQQRICLARALVRKPELLILDEATSNLDNESEALIQQAISDLVHEITIVVIAHRLSTIVQADWIYVIEEGAITEEGTYSELIDRKGSFNHMVNIQSFSD
jgi:ATP-binding cassette subfamily B protein